MESEAEQPLLAAHGASSELEEVLSDSQLPYFQRLRSASWIKFQLLFRLAAPAVAVYMINNAMSISTRIFSGQLGNRDQNIQLFAYGLMAVYFYYL
uniref:Protein DETOXIFICATION 40-like n=1 Tax=Nicotiana tabacum TaxID=4097 RepID=A0A1S3YN77_TOBAC|nr:PREDICTED: protein DETOXIFICATION 40-like [Nicotiana tabacum]